MQKRNMIIAQSGGPSPAINASLAGAVQRAMASPEQIGTVYGALHGLQGLLERKIVSLSDQITCANDFEMLVHTPAMALGSCRFKIKPDQRDEIFSQVLQIFRDYNIGYFFYIGGNDSMDTVARLSTFMHSQGEDIQCIGIPKTVDNDLMETDHTPGFGSAARFVAASFAEIMVDSASYPDPSVTVVEVMGRNAGWLTASSALARSGFGGPHLIFLPEVPFDPEVYLAKVAEKLQKNTHVLVAVSEGIRWKDSGRYVSEKDSGKVDMFGHPSLGGVADVLATLAKDKFNCKTRNVEPSVLQRVGMHLASGTDLREAQEVGITAVEAALAGVTDVMVCIKRVSNYPYLVRYETAPLAMVANHERKVPLEWICGDGTDVTEDMVEYLRPLFRGETHVKYEQGLPRFFYLDRTKLVSP